MQSEEHKIKDKIENKAKKPKTEEEKEISKIKKSSVKKSAKPNKKIDEFFRNKNHTNGEREAKTSPNSEHKSKNAANKSNFPFDLIFKILLYTSLLVLTDF